MRKRKSLLPKTHEDVCNKKRLFMRLLRLRLDPVTRMDYEQAVNHCDKLTRRVTLAALALTLTASLFVGGCGKWMQAGGLFAEGLGDALVAGGRHMQESSNVEK